MYEEIPVCVNCSHYFQPYCHLRNVRVPEPLRTSCYELNSPNFPGMKEKGFHRVTNESTQEISSPLFSLQMLGQSHFMVPWFEGNEITWVESVANCSFCNSHVPCNWKIFWRGKNYVFCNIGHYTVWRNQRIVANSIPEDLVELELMQDFRDYSAMLLGSKNSGNNVPAPLETSEVKRSRFSTLPKFVAGAIIIKILVALIHVFGALNGGK
jgi:hypothetical protein